MLKRFFILCSGSDADILSDCTYGEQNKYAGIGATVFFTAVLAFLSASYGLYTVFENYFSAIFFGLVWGLLIFNLDRFIVSTLRKKDSITDELLQASPRIILAIIIAVVISKPLELKIFEKEIDRVVLEKKNEYTLANKDQIANLYTPKIEAMDTEMSSLKKEIATKEAEVNQLYDSYISEAEGRQGTKRSGKGPVYQEKREKHDAALAELTALKKTAAERVSVLTAEKTELSKTLAEKVSESQPIVDNYGGLMARINMIIKYKN